MLLVALGDGGLECNGDSFRTRAGISGLLLVNLQIGSTDWVEAKECEETGNSSDDGVRDEGDDEESDNDGSDGGSEGTVEKTAALPYGVPPQLPPIGFFIGVYAQSDTEGMALIRRIEPPAT